MEMMQYNARHLAREIAAVGEFELIGAEGQEQLPLIAFKLTDGHAYDEFDVAAQLAAIRGWMVPAYTLPPNAEHVKVLRVLVRGSLGYTMVEKLGADIDASCRILKDKGGMHPAERKHKVKTNTGF
jgi:glutamate decarboxylase